MNIYCNHNVGEICKLIFQEVEANGESYWPGAEEDLEKYEAVKTFLRSKNIIPLDDMLGSWVKMDNIKKDKTYVAILKHTITAPTEEIAMHMLKDLSGCPEILTFKEEYDYNNNKPPIHVVYWRCNRVFHYRMSNGYSGKCQEDSQDAFENYWRSVYRNRSLTFEDIT